MGLLDKTLGNIGRAAGTFAGEFTKARHGLTERPAFIDAWAKSEQWKGGQNWSDPAAQMRAMTNSWLFMAIDMIAREAGPGTARRGRARLGRARPGWARRGSAGPGWARLGKAWRGRDF